MSRNICMWVLGLCAVTLVATAIAADDQKAAVTIKMSKFDPAELEVKAGTTVTWTNQDSKRHTIRSGTMEAPKDGPLKGELSDQGSTFSFTFKDPGEYIYHCSVHPHMDGKVIVK